MRRFDLLFQTIIILIRYLMHVKCIRVSFKNYNNLPIKFKLGLVMTNAKTSNRINVLIG